MKWGDNFKQILSENSKSGITTLKLLNIFLRHFLWVFNNSFGHSYF